MKEASDLYRYISYIHARRRLIAASAVIAASVALAVSLAIPRQYTATAKIVIEPPAGSDPRGSIAVSPIYLESLRTYEYFALSDGLFQRAVDKFGLRRMLHSRPIEALKKRVLKVEIVRNTRILEISATLPDPRVAQSLAQFLADSTVSLDRSVLNADDRELLQGAEHSAEDARSRLEGIDRQWLALLSREPVDDLQDSLESAGRLREDLQQDEVAAQVEMADDRDRVKRASETEAAEIRRQLADAGARLDELHKRIAAAGRQAAESEKVLAERTARRDNLEASRKAAQESLAAAEGRLRSVHAEAGYRGERLTVIDPGVAPERPSSPNVPLNVGGALLLGFALPMLYLVFEMNFREQQTVADGARLRVRVRERAVDE